MMKFFIKYCFPVLIVLWTFSPAQYATAQNGSFGIGLVVGEPVGVSTKVWLTDMTALSGGIGWSMGGDRMEGYFNNVQQADRFHLHLDYLWHSFDFMNLRDRYPVYAGVGARMNSGAGSLASIAFRGVVGIAWLPRVLPIDVFMELVPMIQVKSSIGLGLDAGVGMRYFIP